MPTISVFPTLLLSQIYADSDSPLLYADTHFYPFLFLFVDPSCLPCSSSQDLATPGREKCHHRSIRQLRSLPNARPFVARAAEEQAVGSHYH